jgi:hypothetical protein
VLQQDLQCAQRQLQQAADVQEQLAAELHLWHGKAGSSQAELLRVQQQRDSIAAELQLWQQWGDQQQQLEAQQQFASVDGATAAWVASPSPQELSAVAGEPEYSPCAPPSPYATPGSGVSSLVSAALHVSSSGRSSPLSAAPSGSFGISSRVDSGSFAVGSDSSFGSSCSSPVSAALSGGSSSYCWQDTPGDSHASSSRLVHRSCVVSSVYDPAGGVGDVSVVRFPSVSWPVPSLGGVSGGVVLGGCAPAAPQVRSRVPLASSAAAAQQVQLPERTAGGLDQVPWSKSVGGPGPP